MVPKFDLSVQCPSATTLNHTTSNWVSSVTLVSRLKERLLSLKSSGVWPFSNWTFHFFSQPCNNLLSPSHRDKYIHTATRTARAWWLSFVSKRDLRGRSKSCFLYIYRKPVQHFIMPMSTEECYAGWEYDIVILVYSNVVSNQNTFDMNAILHFELKLSSKANQCGASEWMNRDRHLVLSLQS